MMALGFNFAASRNSDLVFTVQRNNSLPFKCLLLSIFPIFSMSKAIIFVGAKRSFHFSFTTHPTSICLFAKNFTAKYEKEISTTRTPLFVILEEYLSRIRRTFFSTPRPLTTGCFVSIMRSHFLSNDNLRSSSRVMISNRSLICESVSRDTNPERPVIRFVVRS